MTLAGQIKEYTLDEETPCRSAGSEVGSSPTDLHHTEIITQSEDISFYIKLVHANSMHVTQYCKINYFFGLFDCTPYFLFLFRKRRNNYVGLQVQCV